MRSEISAGKSGAMKANRGRECETIQTDSFTHNMQIAFSRGTAFRKRKARKKVTFATFILDFLDLLRVARETSEPRGWVFTTTKKKNESKQCLSGVGEVFLVVVMLLLLLLSLLLLFFFWSTAVVVFSFLYLRMMLYKRELK